VKIPQDYILKKLHLYIFSIGYLFGHMDDQDMMTSIAGNPDYMEDEDEEEDENEEDTFRDLDKIDEIR
jgi:hypothetical protein